MMLDDAIGLSAADVIHKQFSALPATATVGDVREWFAASSHRQMALLADEGRYAGSLSREDVAGDHADDVAALKIARNGPTIAPEAPARAGHELALSTGTRRVPVVDRDGKLLGVVGVTDDLAAFCGAG